MALHVPPRIQSEGLKTTGNTISFDPLSVATVLPNPRATSSAVRLYTQTSRKLFRFPYLMQIGGTLPPLGALVDHILSTSHAVHPALALVLQGTQKLDVSSNTIWKELPVDFSKAWIAHASDYRPSNFADNDMIIISIDETDEVGQEGNYGNAWALLFDISTFITGLIIVLELIISVFLGDMWATALFFIYLSQWLASTMISYSTPMIRPRASAVRIREDPTLRFAIHQRKEGGTIVFKGRQDSMEKWARQTWEFDQRPWKSFLHWVWIVTGALASVASTIAMVNMFASLQLGFLGLLLTSSSGELLLSRVSTWLELRPRRKQISSILRSETRTKAIIRAALEPNPLCRLDKLNWIELKKLPDTKIFREMLRMLSGLSTETSLDKISEESFEHALQDFRQEALATDFGQPGPRLEDTTLIKRIVTEVRNVRNAVAVLNREHSREKDSSLAGFASPSHLPR